MVTASNSAALADIPSAQEVRQRLGKAVREAALLRRLLKVAEAAEKERRGATANAAEVAHVG